MARDRDRNRDGSVASCVEVRIAPAADVAGGVSVARDQLDSESQGAAL